MVRVELENQELLRLIELAKGDKADIERAIAEATISDEPGIELLREQLQRDYQQAYALALKLTMYYQNRERA
jgi:hypothetical protein